MSPISRSGSVASSSWTFPLPTKILCLLPMRCVWWLKKKTWREGVDLNLRPHTC
jgi:hypothetical protein